MEKIILLLIGLFGVYMLVSGIIILFNHNFGVQSFKDWNSLKKNIARLAVTSVIFFASSFAPQSSLLFIAGCILAFATTFYLIMGRLPKGRKYVQSFLVDSHNGQRIYVLCAFFPMSILMIVGAFFS